MNNSNKLKILNDPIYGFISLPNTLIFDLVQHPHFQRLRRISQMGMSSIVYPGAHHTRFHHALGCLHLMQKVVQVLRFKQVVISEEEENALYVAILLHDMGHGPFSHAMEHSIVNGLHHEMISLAFMNHLNEEFGGQLTLAIDIFKGNYPRKFLLHLISSQLDMDRMDYLKRDSFYSGVAEGNINSDRLIQMLHVVDDQLVVEEKGIYSVEKFLVSRRLMYWQTYLHKTSLAAEMILTKILKRAKELCHKGEILPCSNALLFFMKQKEATKVIDSVILNQFARLDDYDVFGAIKEWQYHDDFVLSKLCQMIINRDLPKIKMNSKSFSKKDTEAYLNRFKSLHQLTSHEASFFIFTGSVDNQAYNEKGVPIQLLMKDGSLVDVIKASDQLNLKALSKRVTKYYICYPKVLV